MKAELNPEQEILKQDIKNLYNEAMSYLDGVKSKIPSDRMNEILSQLNTLSHKLHIQLDPEPKHHEYMIKNRGMSPSDPNFYNHIQAVQDLLEYLEDVNANDDPEDITLNEEFDFKIYTRRWGHYDFYKMIRNEKGWHISFMSHEGQAGKNADPVLSYMLRHDGISYPQNLSDIMEDIWIRAKIEGLTKQQVQEMLDTVSSWIEVVERNFPEDIAR